MQHTPEVQKLITALEFYARGKNVRRYGNGTEDCVDKDGGACARAALETYAEEAKESAQVQEIEATIKATRYVVRPFGEFEHAVHDLETGEPARIYPDYDPGSAKAAQELARHLNALELLPDEAKAVIKAHQIALGKAQDALQSIHSDIAKML